MQSIGIRELRQHASRFLRRVQHGESIEVTDRGRPIALLVPVPQSSPLERLAATGRLELASIDLAELGDPLEPAAGKPLPSEALAQARADER